MNCMSENDLLGVLSRYYALRTHLPHGAVLGKGSLLAIKTGILSQVVQSIVILTSSLVVKMLTVLVGSIANSQYFC